MALYSELPVYKAAYLLLLRIVGMSVSWQRDYRYTLGQELKQEILDLLMLIYRSNRVREKASLLMQARESIEKIKIYIRLLRDLKQIGAEKYTSLIDETGSISKQLSRWHARYNENENENENGNDNDDDNVN